MKLSPATKVATADNVGSECVTCGAGDTLAVKVNQAGGEVVPDGSAVEWNLYTYEDFIAKMYEAGNPDKVHAATAFGRFDCVEKKLCVAVVAEAGFSREGGLSITGNDWIRDRDLQNGVISGTQAVIGTSGQVGWEH